LNKRPIKPEKDKSEAEDPEMKSFSIYDRSNAHGWNGGYREGTGMSAAWEIAEATGSRLISASE